MMKSMIRYMPGPGWAMLLLDYPYISRKWETDQTRIKTQIAKYKQAASGMWLCMFPEGTALFRKTLDRSHAFAKERGLKLWDYVLIPRVRGFELCVNEMDADCVLDVTVGYPELQDGVRPSPVSKRPLNDNILLGEAHPVHLASSVSFVASSQRLYTCT
jgi:lysocardiolipin and lysophospholipid acyltransferase